METVLWCLGTGVVTAAWATWRLKGDRSLMQAALAVLGGPRPTTPK